MADYGTIPGKGSPTADDKKVSVGSGWVVPKNMAGYAKSLLKLMGYNPNKKKKMNSNGPGENINISSGEVFLNDDQVKGIEEMGIDPRTLSPGSPHNAKYNSGGPPYNTRLLGNPDYEPSLMPGQTKVESVSSQNSKQSNGNFNQKAESFDRQTTTEGTARQYEKQESDNDRIRHLQYFKSGDPDDTYGPELQLSGTNAASTYTKPGTFMEQYLNTKIDSEFGRDRNLKKGGKTGKTKSLFPSLFNQNNNLNGHSNSYPHGGPHSGPAPDPTAPYLDLGDYGIEGATGATGATGAGPSPPVIPPNTVVSPNTTPENTAPPPTYSKEAAAPIVTIPGKVTSKITYERWNPDGPNTPLDSKGNPLTTAATPTNEDSSSSDEEYDDIYYSDEDENNEVTGVDPNAGTGTGAGGGGASLNRLGAPPPTTITPPANTGGYKPGMYTDEYGNVYQVGKTGKIRSKANLEVDRDIDKVEREHEFEDKITRDLDKEWYDQDPKDLEQSGLTLTPYTEDKKEMPEFGDAPDDEYLKSIRDRLDKSKQGSNAWLAMAALNNLTQSPEKLVPPSRVTAPIIHKDWDKFRREQGEKNIRTGAGIVNKLMQTGMGEFTAGVDANLNTKNLQTENIINEGQFKEQAWNTQKEWASLLDYEQAKRKNDYINKSLSADFADKKSQANSKLLTAKLNADQAFLGNNAYYDRILADRENTKLDNEYDSLDKNKMSKDYDYISPDQWRRMSPADRENFIKNYGSGDLV